MFISRYEVSLHYGGAEEGGWWYDWCDLQAPVLISADADLPLETLGLIAQTLTEAALEEKRERGGHARHSVIGTADTVFMVEETLGEHQTTERPHYC